MKFEPASVVVNVAPLMGGALTDEQSDSVMWLVREWNAREDLEDERWLAYMLATALYQTGGEMLPNEQTGHAAAALGEYLGRGFAHPKGQANYADLSMHMGVNLVAEPDLAKRPDIARRILFDGMIHGLLQGHAGSPGLAEFFSPDVEDWEGAAATVGHNNALKVAAKARKFRAALLASDPPIVTEPEILLP